MLFLQIGADCSTPGTSIVNVNATIDYYAGLDGSNTWFGLCLKEGVCLEDNSCFPGYRGPACTECENHTESGQILVLIDGFECSTCSGLFIDIFLIILCILAFAGFLLFSYISDVGAETVEMHSIFFKIFISACQVNSLALSFSFDYEESLNEILGTADQIASIGTAYVETQCLFRNSKLSSFEVESILEMIFPICTMVLILSCLVVLRLTQGQSNLNELEGHNEVSKQEDDQSVQEKQSIPPSSIDALVALSSITLFFCHPTLTSQGAALFNCQKMGQSLGAHGKGIYRLYEDLHVECWSTEHLRILYSIGPGLLLYGAGVPTSAWYFILINRDKVQYLAIHDRIQHSLNSLQIQEYKANLKDSTNEVSSTRFWHQFGFLVIGYKTQFPWYIYHNKHPDNHN